MVYLDEQVVRLLVDAFNRRDMESVLKLFDENVLLHCPGKNRVSGDYQGRSALLDFWRKQIELTGGTFKGQVITVCQADEHLVLIAELSAQRNGKDYTWRRAIHYSLYQGRVTEGWLYENNQYSADEVFA